MLSNCPERQQGATLVLAMIVVLLVVTIATRMGSDYLLLFRSVQNQSELQQARNYLRGAESLAREGLLADARFTQDIDSYLEPWAQPQQLPLPEGTLSACLLDLQSRFNLNDLFAPEGAYSSAQLRFIRLLQVLPLEPALDAEAARALANAVFDWLDQDNQTRYPGGAETLEYQQKQPAYRPANQPFVSVSELALVAGFNAGLVAALTPYLSVWGNGAVNFNTLDTGLSWSLTTAENRAEPMLLRTINNDTSLLPLSSEAATKLAAMRSNLGGFVSDLDFLQQGEFAALNWDIDGIGMSSEYFQLTANMNVAKRYYQLETVLQRSVSVTGIPTVSVLSRRYSQGQMNQETACAVALP